ncbi:hypothetical protein J6590_026762 [Homalodisca vitripennis]|nr:hypothetical protein J6590_026762 [Homalodisca vitripennis]
MFGIVVFLWRPWIYRQSPPINITLRLATTELFDVWLINLQSGCQRSRHCAPPPPHHHTPTGGQLEQTGRAEPVTERCRVLNSGTELEVAQVQVLYMIVARIVSTIDLEVYQFSSLFCLIRSLHGLVAYADRQNKAEMRIGLSLKKHIVLIRLSLTLSSCL